MPTESRPGPTRLLVLLMRLITAVYWVAMCLGTHLPNPPDVVPSNVSDKWLHLGAYFGLAVLLIGSLAAGRRVTRRDAIRVWLVTICYGALDELTQMIPVLHRSAEWKDLGADAAGAAVGVLLGLVLASWIRAGRDG